MTGAFPPATAPARSRAAWVVAALGAFGLPPVTVAAQEAVRARGFAGVGFSASTTDGEPAQFFLGQLDNYVTGELSDRVDFLTEAVIEYDDDWVLDLERIWMRYSLTPSLSVSAGKFHTPIGYWNRAFHHGALLQTSVDRPLLFAFEDEGGPLPIHTLGVLISGSQIGSAEVGFEFMVGNGIGSSPMSDDNRAKSISGRVSARPSDRLSMGIFAYRDRISAGTTRPTTAAATIAEVAQTLLGADAQIRLGQLDVLSEFVFATNTTTLSHRSWGYYVLASVNANDRLTPYLKVDELRFAAADPYFDAPSTRVFAAGARFSLGLLAALKAEVLHMPRGDGAESRTALELRLEFGW